MKLKKSNREKQIDFFIENIKSQNEYEKENEKKISKILNIYKEELNEYTFVKNINEFINLHPKATEVVPIVGKMFTNEPVPIKGEVSLTDLPGFGAELNDEVELEEIKL